MVFLTIDTDQLHLPSKAMASWQLQEDTKTVETYANIRQGSPTKETSQGDPPRAWYTTTKNRRASTMTTTTIVPITSPSRVPSIDYGTFATTTAWYKQQCNHPQSRQLDSLPPRKFYSNWNRDPTRPMFKCTQCHTRQWHPWCLDPNNTAKPSEGITVWQTQHSTATTKEWWFAPNAMTFPNIWCNQVSAHIWVPTTQVNVLLSIARHGWLCNNPTPIHRKA